MSAPGEDAVLPSSAVPAHRLLAPELSSLAPGKMSMTSNMARKIAARQGVAMTDEPDNLANETTGLGAPQSQPDKTGQERYMPQEAADGVPAADIDRLRAVWHAEARANQLRHAADQAREQAEQAEDAAAAAAERAEYGQEAANLAQEWAGEHDRRLARERADQMRRAADVARERADRAEEAAEQAEDAADEADERAEELMAWASEADDQV